MVNGINMNNEDTELTPQQQAEIDALMAMPDDEIDTSDIPEIINWSGPKIRGLFHLPPDERRKAIEELRRSHPANADTSEHGLESYITALLTGMYGTPPPDYYAKTLRERPATYGVGWLPGEPADYDREHCVDLPQLTAFLKAAQPDAAKSLSLDADTTTRRQFLARLKAEVGRRGVIDVLRKGIRHRQHDVTLFYASPSPGNERAAFLYRQNRFSVTRQLRYSGSQKNLALDLALFVNGLPIATFELKNSLTKQTVADAVQQYKRDRSPREDLFEEGRCAVHFAVDDHEVRFCTKLDGDKSVFLPFNKGYDGGAGNPVNPDGIKTDYLWRGILTRESLTDIIQNYTQMVDGRQLWPRYHQLDVVRKLLADAGENGVGQKYLIQHSAGSGKSNSIAWLSRLLIGLEKDGKAVFDSIVVITDRKILDRQIDDVIRQFTHVSATVGHADDSAELRRLLREGKKIITTTVQKFLFIHDEISSEHRNKTYAIIIDEAHSSQGGRTASAMSAALGDIAADSDDGDDFEDRINRVIERRKMLTNASYFAFTATPKNKTLEMFGKPESQPDGSVKHLPFHSYTMKQAIQEGFILDVLQSYTPIKSYYDLIKTIEDDPEFDSRRAHRKLRRYVEQDERAIRLKAEIMADHFHDSVWRAKKIGQQARAMVVTDGVDRAIRYYHALKDYMAERNRPYQPMVAFSGERDYAGKSVSESSLNGFPESRTKEKFQDDPYRILVCADKFQTGYDEPLLHTMYVDKRLSGVRAVQTLSRLNRARNGKSDVFVLDFLNDADTIGDSFAPYYRTTILSDETDPNKLHDLKATLDDYQVYSQGQVNAFVEAYLNGAERETLDPILDSCVEVYRAELDEDGQVRFKGSAKSFVRVYAFLCQILPYSDVEWEKLSIFLNFLIPKLPAPVEEDLSIGILDAIDMSSYRIERREAMAIELEDGDIEIDPVPASSGGGVIEPDMDPLSVIIAEFNSVWAKSDGSISGNLLKALPDQVMADEAYRNARKNSDKQNARIEHDAAMLRAIVDLISCSADLYKLYTENDAFKSWLNHRMFELTYNLSA